MKHMRSISCLVALILQINCFGQGTVTLSTEGVQYGNIDLDIFYISPTKDEVNAKIIPCFTYVSKTTGASGYRANSLAPSKLMLIQFGCNPSYSPLAGYATYNINCAGKQYIKIRYSKHSIEGIPIVISMNGVSYSFNPVNQSSWEKFTTSPWFEFDFPDPVLNVTPASKIISSSSGTTTFTVSSNIDWSASENSDWLSVTKTNETTISVNYNQNTSVNNRSANITLSGTGVTSQVVTVTQSGVTPSLSVTPSSKTVNAASGLTTFNIAANIVWEVSENSNWLTATKTNSTIMTISYNENNSEDERTAILIISGPGVISQSIIFTQNGSTLTKIKPSESGFDGSKIRLYPVPCKDFLYIDTNYGKDLILQVFNSDGKPVKQFSIVSSVLKINLSDMKRGLYFYRILQRGSLITSGKFIKE
jgi:hypothetical protein